MIADPRTGIQVRDARVFRARQCTRKENPTDFPLMDRGLTVGFLRFERSTHKPFFICGYSFQNELGFQRDGDSFGPGFPIGARAPCWQRIPKGTRCLGRKNPMKPAVSWHTTLSAKSCVFYLWRPWVAERDCSGREQSLSVSHRTGGFCVLPDEKPRSLR